MYPAQSLLLLLLSTCLLSPSSAQQQQSCRVTEQRTGDVVPCKFPFVLNGTEHNKCTTQQDPDDRLWCSTKTTEDDYHVGNGQWWGYCNEGDCSSTATADDPVDVKPKDGDNQSEDSNEQSDNQSEDNNGPSNQAGAGSEDFTQPRIKPNENAEENEIVEDVNTQLSDLELSFRQNIASEAADSCPCLVYSECPSLARLIRQGNRLQKRHPVREKILAFLKTLKCQGAGRLLRCCDPDIRQTIPESPSTKPTPTTQASPTTRSTTNTSDPDLGTWRPDPSRDECGLRTISTNIIGGKVSKLGELAFMALLAFEVRGQEQYACGGTLINKRYVLTAAHCFNKRHEFPLTKIVLGENDLKLNPDCYIESGKRICGPNIQILEVESIAIHPEYDRGNFKNDIALVRLKTPAVLYTEVGRNQSLAMPVCLPWKSSDPAHSLPDASRGTVAGWGRVTNNIREVDVILQELLGSTRFLQQLDVPILDDDFCEETFKSQKFESERQICAGGEEGKDSCNGDSGGPLVFRTLGSESPWFQVGIVSYGTKVCGRSVPGAYTRLTYYMDWIAETVRP